MRIVKLGVYGRGLDDWNFKMINTLGKYSSTQISGKSARSYFIPAHSEGGESFEDETIVITEHNGNMYHFEFYGVDTLTDVQKKILASVQLTTLPVPADSPKITSVSSKQYQLGSNTKLILVGTNLIDSENDQTAVIKDSGGRIGFVNSTTTRNSDGTHSISFDPNGILCRTEYADRKTCDGNGWYITPGGYTVRILKYHVPGEISGRVYSNEVSVDFVGKY